MKCCEYNGWKEVAFVVALGLIVFLVSLVCGCSHNPGSYMFGEQTRIGFGEYGSYNSVSGMLLTDVPRENSSFKIEVDKENGISYDPASGTLKGIISVSRSVGEQITGYLVDLAKVSPEAAVEYLKSKNNAMPVYDEEIKSIESRLDAIEEILTSPIEEKDK